MEEQKHRGNQQPTSVSLSEGGTDQRVWHPGPVTGNYEL